MESRLLRELPRGSALQPQLRALSNQWSIPRSPVVLSFDQRARTLLLEVLRSQ